MCPSHRRLRTGRTARFESFEPRWLFCGDPLADLSLDYFVENQAFGEPHALVASADDLTGLGQVRADYGFTGKGQTVAVIDTGIAYTHPALGGGLGSQYRVVGGFDFSERDTNPYDDGPLGSHGTHVAGIIGGSDPARLGLAPGVDLVGLRVFDDAGSGSFQWVEQALQWVHANRNSYRYPITTVNLSLGADWNSTSPPAWASLEDEFAQLQSDGIFIAVAAGNGFGNYNQPGLSYPAASPHVVPVGSVDNDGNLSYFSQRQQRMIAAPGRSVLSTVPDYAGNQNGVSDDFARYSGTSMAAPYVAGASVLLREAYQFVGAQSVTQQTLYNLMVQTADTVYDPATQQSYRRLNLHRAIDTIMPDDDFASSEAAAYSLGAVATTRSLSGAIENLRDRDWFRFTAVTSGSATITVDATGELRPVWQGSLSASAPARAAGNVLSFDVVAGQTYTVGLGGSGAVGRYTLGVELTPTGYAPDTDWGTIGQATISGNRVAGNGQWYTFSAGLDGILTVEALFAHAQGDVDLELYNAAQQLLASSRQMTDWERIDVLAAAGQTFRLRASVYGGGGNDRVDFRLTNLVSLSGDTARVQGTAGGDTLAFTAGATQQVTVNGVAYQFDRAVIRSVIFDGQGGLDAAVLTGGKGNDTALLRPGAVELNGGGYRVEAGNVENVIVHGGAGTDRAVFHDSTGNDTFVATPGYGGLSAQSFSLEARGFEAIEAYATAGGADVARFYDSAGNDLFVATPSFAGLWGEGFNNQARGFKEAHAFATAGGSDTAKFYDSLGDDSFVATPTEATLSGRGFHNRAKFFEAAHAFATAGGIDTATLYDSAADDIFADDGTSRALFGPGFYNRAKFFEQVEARGGAGGNDRAYLRALAADDLFQAAAGQARLRGRITASRLDGFAYVRAAAVPRGVNRAEVAAVDYVLELAGQWN